MLTIDRSPFFKLLLLVNLTSRPFARLFERRYRIKLSEWRVLLSLAERPGITATELGDLLGLDKMAISRAVRGLEQHDRLARVLDETDLRRAKLSLTEAGMSLYCVIAPSAKAREAQLMSALDPQEMAALQAILAKLVARARVMSDAPADMPACTEQVP
jgi:DNA-binding MarR family transcriptional regulator